MNVHSVLYNFDVGGLDFDKGHQAEEKKQKIYFDTKSQTQDEFLNLHTLECIRNLNYIHDKPKG